MGTGAILAYLQVSPVMRSMPRFSWTGRRQCAARWTASLFVLLASHCGSSDAEATGAVADAAPPEVQIGVPAGEDGLDFAPLPPGAELRLQTFGQGGTHVLLAIRCIGFGTRAFVGITLTNALTGAKVVSAAPVRPQLLLCHDAGVCDLVPILAMASGIAEPGVDRNGLPIEIAVDVHNQAGLASSASEEAVLSTADLL